ncbi:hypothetical protein M9X92_000267 [Pyricularia oryzae]|nr:hypothetical protein M9X92_000267 [Pyricularia oryzae]
MGGTRTGALLARGMSGKIGARHGWPWEPQSAAWKKEIRLHRSNKQGRDYWTLLYLPVPYYLKLPDMRDTMQTNTCIFQDRSCESFRLPPESGNCSADKDLDLGIELDFSRRVQKRRAMRVVDSIPEPSKIQK